MRSLRALTSSVTAAARASQRALQLSQATANPKRALATLSYLPKLHASIPANLTSIQQLVNEYEVINRFVALLWMESVALVSHADAVRCVSCVCASLLVCVQRAVREFKPNLMVQSNEVFANNHLRYQQLLMRRMMCT